MELTEETPVEMEEAAELEDGSVIGSFDLTSSPSNERSMFSYISEGSTELTMPEMDATTFSKNETVHEPPSRIREIDSWPPSPLPQSEYNSVGPSELHSDASSPIRGPLQHEFELRAETSRTPTPPATNCNYKATRDTTCEEPPVWSDFEDDYIDW